MPLTDITQLISDDRRHLPLGLLDEEYRSIIEILGRVPSDVELAMYSVMWSEHCSYKSSRIHLGRLPTKAKHVLVGPGENAGVIDVGDGVAVALRIESHNHPSFIEPYQGAATGVGGILRDIFTMGARPIALMDPLFVGPLEDAHSRYLLDGIVRGIGGYGNSVGVPTVGGQITFDRSYERNPLVNVFCLGVLPVDRLVLGQASGAGNLCVLLGSRTGRDGIGGVSVLASAGFRDDEGGSKRPSVQVGDPYEEKRLIEACLELLDAKLVVGIQDLGGAGLACATSETAARGGVGMDVDVRAVPRREPGMSAIEVMTSESQERMLAIITPSAVDQVLEVCRRWEIEATIVATVTGVDENGIGHLRVLDGPGGAVLADVPAKSLADDAPLYDRPMVAPPDLAERLDGGLANALVSPDYSEDLASMLVDPAWIYRQYDHQLFVNTIFAPGEADATLLRLAGPGIERSQKGLAMSSDANPAWCATDPRRGTRATVAESALNVSATGATPLALVNCLNFGNPEHPQVMWELSESIDGMAEACDALAIPVVGGNVSFYNESAGRDIDPTPTVAVIGLIDIIKHRPPSIGWRDGDFVVLLGERSANAAGSRWARDLHGIRSGQIDEVNLVIHRALCEFVSACVRDEAALEIAPDLVHGLHTIGDGGLGVALAEMCIASGIGCAVDQIVDHRELFSESVSRVLVATLCPTELISAARAKGLRAMEIGTVGGDRLIVSDLVDLKLEDLGARFHDRIDEALGEVASH
ncbi:MAG TPA: phosphoribosylformylglycinamidine synthase subunit PurL [Acidimicrobiales bacterium]|nr:phosphoribosylformylglycinamidine synthase subunit PurL [Acidimicrobiales bacterium]